jgi:hypothetical protein
MAAQIPSHIDRIWQKLVDQEPSADRVLSVEPRLFDQLEPYDIFILTQIYW